MYSFDKTRRLLTKSDYDFVFAQAKRITSPEFIVLYRDNTIGFARVGLALSRKAIAKAHDRNRIKRVVRETFRMQQLRAVDIVILARPGAGRIQQETIIASIGKIWDKLCER